MTNALWQRSACLCEGTGLTLHPGDDCQCGSTEEEVMQWAKTSRQKKRKTKTKYKPVKQQSVNFGYAWSLWHQCQNLLPPLPLMSLWTPCWGVSLSHSLVAVALVCSALLFSCFTFVIFPIPLSHFQLLSHSSSSPLPLPLHIHCDLLWPSMLLTCVCLLRFEMVMW